MIINMRRTYKSVAKFLGLQLLMVPLLAWTGKKTNVEQSSVEHLVPVSETLIAVFGLLAVHTCSCPGSWTELGCPRTVRQSPELQQLVLKNPFLCYSLDRNPLEVEISFFFLFSSLVSVVWAQRSRLSVTV